MNNFFTRKRTEPVSGDAIQPNYNEFISIILKTFPTLKLDPNSQLASLAIEQYNDKVKNSTFVSRPPVPNWFCGFQDINTGELYISTFEDDSNRIRAINSSLNVPLSALSVSAIRFESDFCLSLGQPGSYSYSFCDLLDEQQFDPTFIRDIDWSTAFYPDELIADTISAIEDAVLQEVSAAIAASQMEDSAGGASGSGSGSEHGPNSSEGCTNCLLWTPTDSTSGKLLLLLPCSFVSESSVEIEGTFGKERAGKSGTSNGGRPNFRFSKAGSLYGTNIRVRGLNTGGRWTINNGATRSEICIRSSSSSSSNTRNRYSNSASSSTGTTVNRTGNTVNLFNSVSMDSRFINFSLNTQNWAWPGSAELHIVYNGSDSRKFEWMTKPGQARKTTNNLKNRYQGTRMPYINERVGFRVVGGGVTSNTVSTVYRG